MNKRNAIKSIVEVTFSNVITILSGIVTGLLLPKLISVNDYGWYKTFSLYSSYLGLLSLGIIDGIVLRHGGDDLEDLDQDSFRGYFNIFFLIQLFFAVILFLTALFVPSNDYSFVFIALSIYLFSTNITGYFQQISQITQRFKEYSFRKILNSVLRVLSVGVVFLVTLLNFRPTYKLYIVLFLICDYVLTVWYLFTYKNFVFGKRIDINESKIQVIKLSKLGFPLLFANICSTLLLSIDRQFVSVLFDKNTYAIYAFAYNLLSLFTVATSAVSTVLYPILKRTDANNLKTKYSTMISFMSIIVFFVIIFYFPLCWFIKWFLPNYCESLIILRIVFPGLVLSTSITVIMHNFYKTEGATFLYFKKSIIVLLLSIFSNAIAYFMFQSTSSISVASIISMFIWYVYVEQFFVNQYQYNRFRNLLYIIMMMAGFYIITSLNNLFISSILYFTFFTLLTLVFWNKLFKSIFKNI